MPQKVELNSNEPSKFILIGEDDPDDQILLKDVFANIDSSFILFFVDSGKEILSAVDKLRGDHRPCLVVLDFNMPGMSGADILKAINDNEEYKEIPKIIWSTSSSDKFKKICLELGAADYVIKPSSTSELEKVARYMLSLCN